MNAKKETIPAMNASEKNKKTPVWIFFIGFFLLGLFLILIAQGIKNTNQTPVSLGQKAPDFSLTTFNSETFSTAQLNGKILVVNFWASWCKPCEQEAADLENAYQKYKEAGDVIFMGVDYVDTETEAQAYLQKFNVTYPNGPDLRTAISQAYRISGVPETYFIDKNGMLAYIKIGPFSSLEEITAIIDKIRQ